MRTSQRPIGARQVYEVSEPSTPTFAPDVIEVVVRHEAGRSVACASPERQGSHAT